MEAVHYLIVMLLGAVFGWLLGLLIGALPAAAQVAQCGGYADVLADLSNAYGERIVWVGERSDSGQLVITAKSDGSTWTALLVRGELACLASAGTGWVAHPAGEDI